MRLRKEFVLRALEGGEAFSDLCARFGISRKTGYKWKERFLADGLAGLSDQSRRPGHSPARLAEECLCALVRLKLAHPTWGPKKIRALYARLEAPGPLPSLSSVKRVLDRAGLVQPRRRRAQRACGRLQTPRAAHGPNDVWTVDFKGWWYTAGHQRCEPLTVRDLFSRYVLTAAPLPNARGETVRAAFETLFGQHGLPAVIRSDNGAPFACTRAPRGLSRLSAWWLALGIDLDRIAPGRPDQNGAHERMHRDLAGAVQRRVDGPLELHREALEIWRHDYNHRRPHEALAMRTPADLYRPSPRPFAGTPDMIDYADGWLPRKVGRAGAIRLDGMAIGISTALAGWHVGLRPDGPKGYQVAFGRLPLGRIDTATWAFHPEAP